MRSARQALTEIAAWADDMDGSEPVFLDRLRAVLADVQPEAAVVWDRDAARERLWPLWDSAHMTDVEAEEMLDALEGCVRPGQAQTIDRDALSEEVWLLVDIVDDAMWTSQRVEQAIDRVLALLRPVDGVTLTREEAAFVRQNVLHDLVESNYDPEDVALGQRIAARLEAAS